MTFNIFVLNFLVMLFFWGFVFTDLNYKIHYPDTRTIYCPSQFSNILYFPRSRGKYYSIVHQSIGTVAYVHYIVASQMLIDSMSQPEGQIMKA